MNDRKQCSSCERMLTREKFTKSNKTADGLQRWCKDCYREYYLSHRESAGDVEPTERLSLWQGEPFDLTDRHKMLLLIADIELDLTKLRRLINQVSELD